MQDYRLKISTITEYHYYLYFLGVYFRNRRGQTAIHVACIHGNIAVVNHLLEALRDVSIY